MLRFYQASNMAHTCEHEGILTAGCWGHNIAHIQIHCCAAPWRGMMPSHAHATTQAAASY